MNIYGASSIFPGCGIDGQNVAPQPGTATLRLDPATSKLQLSNNGGAYLDVGSGNSGKSVVAGTNISVTTDISGNWVTSTILNPTFTSLTATSGLVNNVDLSGMASTIAADLNQPVKTTSTPTFAGASLTGPLTTTSTLDGVLLGAFHTDYTAKINQALLTTSSPSFTTLTTTNGLVNGINISSIASVINADLDQSVKTTSSPSFVGLSLSAPLVTSSTVDGVDLSVFKADYDSKINQAVLTSSTPTFTAVDVGMIGSLLQSGTELQLVGNTSSTGLRLTYGPTLTRRSVLVNETDGLWAHRLGTPSLVATSVGTDSVYAATALSLGVGVVEKVRLTASNVGVYDDFFIRPDVDSIGTLKLSSAASRATFLVDSADGNLSINGPATSTSEFLATQILANNQSAGTLTTTLLGVNAASMNCFKTSFGYVSSGNAGNYLSFSGYGAYQPALTLDTNGNTFYTSQADLLTQTYKYQYAQTSNLEYRLVTARLNSGNGPSGRNRMEWYGINGQYIAGSTPAAFTKTYGFTFQQQPSVGAGYYDVLDIDYDGVKTYDVTPLVSNYIQPNTVDVLAFRGRTAIPSQVTDFGFYNNSISSVGLKITANASRIVMKGASSTNPMALQCYIAGTASDAMVFGSTGVSANYFSVGSSSSNVIGSIRLNSTSPEWYDGGAWTPFQLAGGLVSTNTITCTPASAMYLRGNGLTTTQAQSYYLSNNQLDTTALHIRPDGSTDTVYVKSLTGTASIVHQAYIASTATAVATIDTNGLSLDYLRVGSNGQTVAGGLRNTAGTLQFHNGTAWKDVVVAPLPTPEVIYYNVFATVTCGMSGGSPSHTLLTSSTGGALTNGTNATYFNVGWSSLPAGWSYFFTATVTLMAFGTQSAMRLMTTQGGSSVQIQPSLDGSGVNWSAVTSGQILVNIVGNVYRT